MYCYFDEDLRFCPKCIGYVRFLSSPTQSYCAECGGIVKIYSPEDMAELRNWSRKEESIANRLGSSNSDHPFAV